MSRVDVDRLTGILPELDELRPVLDHVLATSTPDPRRVWSGSGELGTVGGRLVDADALAERAGALADDVRDHLADVFGRIGRAARALEGDDPGRAATLLVEIAELEEDARRPERAEAYALAALDLARSLDEGALQALALRRAARAARTRGALDDALARYRDAHEIASVVGSPRPSAEAAIGAGNVLEQRGRWEEAEAWYRRALDAIEDEEDDVPERWQAAVNLHIVLRSRGLLDESAEWLAKAEEAAGAVGDAGAAVFLENARGQLQMARGNFEEAEGTFRRALSRAEDSRARVTVRLNLAEGLLARGRSLEAAEEVREAEREALADRVVGRLPEVYRLLGRIAAAEGSSHAFVLFERAIGLVRDRGLPRLEEAATLQAYADSERRGGDEETADDLLRRAREIYDELGIRHLRRRWVDQYGAEEEAGGTKDHE